MNIETTIESMNRIADERKGWLGPKACLECGQLFQCPPDDFVKYHDGCFAERMARYFRSKVEKMSQSQIEAYWERFVSTLEDRLPQTNEQNQVPLQKKDG